VNSQREIVIGAYFGFHTLGDFVIQNVAAASRAREFENAKLIAAYRDDRPFKNYIIRMNPWIDQSFAVPDDPNAVIPMEWMCEPIGSNGTSDPDDGPVGFAADVLLVPSMLEYSKIRLPAPRLRIPDEDVPALQALLRQAGVDEKRWFACVHFRESGYQYRAGYDGLRNADPAGYVPMIEHIIREQGGQVVRLGDPSMTELPALNGYVDLSRLPDSFVLQCFALSRARYYVGSDSGPTQLASGMGIPAASTNALGVCVWNEGDVILMKRTLDLNGHVVDYRRVADALPAFLEFRLKNVDIENNRPETFKDIAGHLFEFTKGTTAWRNSWRDDAPPPSGRLDIPPIWHNVCEEAGLKIWPPEN
jgi:putative glycosyltransferase (TIGR04372 family)